MAVLDRERNVIVLRIVYDGPPEAGKTASVRALAGSLGQRVHTPAERDGRTLFFDWMDYTGGRFEGYQIRCQVVTVPGQVELLPRRRQLLAEADVVVFVADSTASRIDETFARLAELPRLTGDAPEPPVGIIFQANKRDLPTAVPLAALQARVREADLKIGVVPSVAVEGAGIRETFVFAVRLALDRVREQLRARTLRVGAPDVDDHGELLRRMKDAEEPAVTEPTAPVAGPVLLQVLAENDEPSALWDEPVAIGSDERPLPPEPSAPSGAIWPPVEGRLTLYEAFQEGIEVTRQRDGSWLARGAGGWVTQSRRHALYRDLESGREALIRWARLHAACAGLISQSRCVVLAATGRGDWRLWQIVRTERSLRDDVATLSTLSRDAAAARLLEIATLLCDMSARLQSTPCTVPCTLETIGRGERSAVYVGLMPVRRIPAATAVRPSDLIGAALAPTFYDTIDRLRAEVLATIRRAPGGGPTAHGAAFLDDLLAQRAAS